MVIMHQILCVILGKRERDRPLFKTHLLNQARNVTTDCRKRDTERNLGVGRVFGDVLVGRRGGERQR